MPNTLLRDALIVLAYIATGLFGLAFFSGPSGYTATIFLPAGIAVGAVLFFSWAALPPVFLGSYLLNFIVGYILFNQHITLTAIADAAIIATGSTIQAAIGGSLFRVKLSFHSVSLISRHNLLLLSMWAPLVCLTAATLAVTGLWLVGTVHFFVRNWFNWWIGDTVGVLIVLPWMLFCLPIDVQIKKWTDQVIHNKAKLQ